MLRSTPPVRTASNWWFSSPTTAACRAAREEAQAYPEYDYLIINADIEDSLVRLRAVVEAERLKVGRLREDFAAWKN